MIPFSKTLINFRGRNNLTQKDLAKLLNVRIKTVCDWENEVVSPTKKNKSRTLYFIKKYRQVK